MDKPMDYAAEATFSKGVMRWVSNGAVPPAEHCAAAKAQGFDVSVARCKEVRVTEQSQLIKEYIANQGPATAEHIAEARAAMGPGVVVVDVLTGRRYTT